MTLPFSFTEYAEFDGLGLATLVERGEITAQELAAQVAAGVERLNPTLNAVLELWDDRVQSPDPALNQAGPFGGLPLLLKDMGKCEAGRKQEAGCRLFKGNVATFSSELVLKFKAAGFNIMGRTSCPDNGYTFASESVLHGQTRNPWDLSRISGGSSSGSAAAVAAGILPIASGSDGGGSIRIPSSICGLVGLKVSRGRQTMAPFASDLTIPEAVEGALTRSVRDTAAVYDALAGSDVGEFIKAAPLPRALRDELDDPKKYRIAVSVEPWGAYQMPTHFRAEVEKCAQLLQQMGHEVDYVTPPIDFEQFYHHFKIHWLGGTLALDAIVDQFGLELSTDLFEHQLVEHIKAARHISLADWLAKDEHLTYVMRQLDAFFCEQAYDLVLTPTMAIDTPTLGSIYRLDNQTISTTEFIDKLFAAVPYTPFCNATGVPAISLPLASEGNGLPLGMHFFGRWGSENKLVNLAAQLEIAQPWAATTPPHHVAATTV